MMSAVLDPLAQLWRSREPRERSLVALAAAVVLLGALYAGVLEPAWTTTQRLKTELPAAQAKSVQVQQLATSAKAHLALSGAAPSQTSLQASLSAANINAAVSAAAPWVVTVNAASGESLWAWLQAHATSKTALKRSANGSWAGELTLE
jgi:type II secretory pathway component PulM